MKRLRFTEEQIVWILQESASGLQTNSVCKNVCGIARSAGENATFVG